MPSMGGSLFFTWFLSSMIGACDLGDLAGELAPLPMQAEFIGEAKAADGQQGSVEYLSPDDSKVFELNIHDGVLISYSGRQFDSTTIRSHERFGGQEIALAVLTVDSRLLASQDFKIRDLRHSSFVSGADVLWAGTIEVHRGQLVRITNDSGHYLPRLTHMKRILGYLELRGVNLAVVEATVYDTNSIGRRVSIPAREVLTLSESEIEKRYFAPPPRGTDLL